MKVTSIGQYFSTKDVLARVLRRGAFDAQKFAKARLISNHACKLHGLCLNTEVLRSRAIDFWKSKGILPFRKIALLPAMQELQLRSASDGQKRKHLHREWKKLYFFSSKGLVPKSTGKMAQEGEMLGPQFHHGGVWSLRRHGATLPPTPPTPDGRLGTLAPGNAQEGQRSRARGGKTRRRKLDQQRREPEVSQHCSAATKGERTPTAASTGCYDHAQEGNGWRQFKRRQKHSPELPRRLVPSVSEVSQWRHRNESAMRKRPQFSPVWWVSGHARRRGVRTSLRDSGRVINSPSTGRRGVISLGFVIVNPMYWRTWRTHD